MQTFRYRCIYISYGRCFCPDKMHKKTGKGCLSYSAFCRWDKHDNQKQLGDGRLYLIFHFRLPGKPRQELLQRRNPGSGSETEAMRNLFTDLLSVAFPIYFFFYLTKDHLLRGGTALIRHSLINNMPCSCVSRPV